MLPPMDGAGEPRGERSQMYLVWGWVLSTLSVLLFLFAIGGLIFAVMAVKRDKAGHGAGMIVLSLFGGMISLTYLASQTLIPRT